MPQLGFFVLGQNTINLTNTYVSMLQQVKKYDTQNRKKAAFINLILIILCIQESLGAFSRMLSKLHHSNKSAS